LLGSRRLEIAPPELTEEIRVNDGSGTFVIRRVQPNEGDAREHRAASHGVRAHEGKAGRAATAPNLRLSFSQFEDTFGEGAVQGDRERYAAQRKSRVEGQSRQEVWKKVRGAIENYLPKVRPGNQTALNTAASPFAAYLAGVHRQIHEQFAHRFLSGLPLVGGPLADPTLVTTLEIVINGDGTLETVGVARSSGFMPFDYGAFSAVMKAAPFPPPPSKILSGDGRTYVHWAFYRNERQCGTFNARPFILPNPGGTPAPNQAPPLQDEGEKPPSGPLLMPDEGELGALEQQLDPDLGPTPERAVRRRLARR
jgi:TonB family protein